MLIKKINSFVLCSEILISSVCQKASGTQATSVNKNDCIVKTEKSNGKKISRKIMDLSKKFKNNLKSVKDFISIKIADLDKKFKNKLEDVKDSIPKGVYTALLATFGVNIMYKILKYGINCCYFDEKNKTLRNAIEPENTATLEVKNKSSFLKEENKTSKNDIQPGDEKEIKGEITQKNEEDRRGIKKSNSASQTNEKDEKNQSTDSTKASSTQKDNSTLETTETVELHLYLGVYSDLLLYLIVNLTPQKWGLQKAWYDFWRISNEKSFVWCCCRFFLSCILWWRVIMALISLVLMVFGLQKKSYIDLLRVLTFWVLPSVDSIAGAVKTFKLCKNTKVLKEYSAHSSGSGRNFTVKIQSDDKTSKIKKGVFQRYVPYYSKGEIITQTLMGAILGCNYENATSSVCFP